MIRNILKAKPSPSIFIYSIFFCCILFLTACSGSVSKLVSNDSKNYLDSGVISIARALPEASNLDRTNSLSLPALGFIPVQYDQYWLEADTNKNTIKLMRGNLAVKTVSASKLNLKNGHFKVALLEKDALWYANDEYFLKRNLQLPVAFSQERYLKGALGTYSIHLDNGQVIHSSAIEDEGIDGVRVASNELKDIFSVLEADSKVIVKNS